MSKFVQNLGSDGYHFVTIHSRLHKLCGFLTDMADLDLCDSKVVEGVVVDSSIFLHDKTTNIVGG